MTKGGDGNELVAIWPDKNCVVQVQGAGKNKQKTGGDPRGWAGGSRPKKEQGRIGFIFIPRIYFVVFEFEFPSPIAEKRSRKKRDNTIFDFCRLPIRATSCLGAHLSFAL
jgi:hypothetical protein